QRIDRLERTMLFYDARMHTGRADADRKRIRDAESELAQVRGRLADAEHKIALIQRQPWRLIGPWLIGLFLKGNR
ncbi:hypothetical protein, partial [Burkholderia gladioli]|uniref:hypothetical protein n=1 Tax=Burkholderia gladioli TaxID=28095 RepID=UPI001ABB7F91